MYILFWIISNGTFAGLFEQLYAYLLFAGGNAMSQTIPYDNNFFILTLFLLVFIAIPFISNKHQIWLLYLVFFLGFLAIYKYAFARQENFHIKAFIDYLLMFFVFALLFVEKIKAITVVLLFSLMVLFNLNLYEEHYGIDDKKECTERSHPEGNTR